MLVQGVHPGRLVVNKPDLPMASDGRQPITCSNPPSSCPTHADLARSPHSGNSRCRCMHSSVNCCLHDLELPFFSLF